MVKIVEKNAKIRDVKILQDFVLLLEKYSNAFSNPRGGSLALEAEKPDKKFQKT